VADECVQPGAPDELRAFIGKRPDWLRIMDAPMDQIPELATLDAGEAAAIHLALSRNETLLLIDERRIRGRLRGHQPGRPTCPERQQRLTSARTRATRP